MWAWGYNNYGQLGNGTTATSLVPVRVGSSTDWQDVSAGYITTIAIKTNGTVWAWGYNGYGQFGNNTTSGSPITTPTNVSTPSPTITNPLGTGWAKIKMTGYRGGMNGDYTVGLKTDGTLWAWGYNGWGQLGDGTTTQRLTKVQVAANPTDAAYGKTWLDFALGDSEIHAVAADGTLWGWGSNSLGEVGDGTNTERHSPVQISPERDWKAVGAAWYASTIAIKTDGSAWGWGGDGAASNVALGNASNIPVRTPTRIGNGNNWIGAAGAYNSIYLLSGTVTPPVTPAVAVAGQLWTSGRGLYGELGNGTTSDRFSMGLADSSTNWTAISGGNAHYLGLKAQTGSGETNSLWTWGYGANGQLGNGANTQANSPVKVGTSNDWGKISAGVEHSLAIKSYTGNTGGDLYSWGTNTYGQLGRTNTPLNTPQKIGTARWLEVATRQYHNLGIQADGSLWAWGRNDYKQLGMSPTSNTNQPTPVKINVLKADGVTPVQWSKVYTGGGTSYAIDTDGKLWSWGSEPGNVNGGNLGLGGNIITQPQPKKINEDTWKSFSSSIYWDGTYYTESDFAIRTDGTLWGWGYNVYWSNTGGLGDGTASFRNVPTLISPDTDWVKVTGGMTSAAIKTDGTLWMWGSQYYACTGNTGGKYTTPTRCGDGKAYTDVAATTGSLIALTGTITNPAANGIVSTEGNLWTGGLGALGKLGNGTSGINQQALKPILDGDDWREVKGGGYHGVGNKGSPPQAAGYSLLKQNCLF